MNAFLDPSKDLVLKRNNQIEIGLVPQSSVFFHIKDNFLLYDKGGIFIEIPRIIFDSSYFDQKISNSPALQAGEYELVYRLSENEMIDYAKKRAFYFGFDLSQLHGLCLGGVKKVFNTLNKEGINYFLPINSKKGIFLARINYYQEGFVLNIDKPSKDFMLNDGILLARYQSLKDPYVSNSLKF